MFWVVMVSRVVSAMVLVKGALASPAPQATGRDETAELTRSTAEMVEGLNDIINDIGYILTEMADQNLDVVLGGDGL